MRKNIDPPYNTGTDGFVYPDNFKFDAKELSKAIGIEEEEATRILNLSGKSSHSAWLAFMYPRLILARDLLSEDGVIFISIDDNEQANLKMVCDEIFGEENFVVQLIWHSRQNKDNRNISGASIDHEYILCYAKQFGNRVIRGTDRKTSQYTNPDNDPRGPWTSANMVGLATADARPNLHYDLVHPTTNINYGCPPKGWRYDKNTMLRLISEERILWPKSPDGRPRRKTFLDELSDNLPGFSSIIEEGIYTNTATKELTNLFNNHLFDFPKPTILLEQLISQTTKFDDIVLDFFSGSATTAHAVMKLNAKDGGNRRYIMVQIPEAIKEDKPAYQAGYRTIDEIGRERIRKAAKQIKEETQANIDYGFKAFVLKPVSQNTLNKMIDFDPSATFLTEDMISVFDTEYASGLSSILATWLNADGYGLTVKAKDYLLKDFRASIIENTLYIIKEGLRTEDVMEFVKRLETMELDISRVVVYPYSVEFSVMHELKKNIKNLRNNKSVEVIERY